jgi:hypothetical protein
MRRIEMPQKTDFGFRIEAAGTDEGVIKACYVVIEPGDMTQYRFLAFRSQHGHGYTEPRLPVIAVASVDGVIFPGIWIPVPHARGWWKDTKDGSDGESIGHDTITWAIQECGRRVKEPINPWTARAALLTVLKLMGEI